MPPRRRHPGQATRPGRVAALAAALGCWAFACSRTPEPSAGAEARAAAPASAPRPPLPTTPEIGPWRYAAAPRVVALGDVHGDLAATRAALRLAGALSPSDGWAGGTLTVVQTGDQLDRGDDERAILDLFRRLSSEARDAGGRFIVLNGNHELMNAAGDFRYATARGSAAFAEFAALPSGARAPAELRGRAAAFFPGGPYARDLATRDVIAVVGDTVFVHGGVHEDHVRYGIGRLNGEVRSWLAGQGAPTRITQGDDSPVWSRRYSEGTPSPAACAELGRVLTALGVRRMVVGHTPQKGVTSGCDGQVWRVDVGMSRHYGGKPAVLVIEGEAVSAKE